MRLLVAIALLLAFPVSAVALPGDPPVQLLAPADGAQVPADADGIPVRLTCPDYRQFAGTITVYGDYTDYEVSFATEPALGVDGRLLDANVVYRDIPSRSNAGADQCTSAMENDGPEVTPGTYYWQAARMCTGCASGYETSPVRRFSVQTTLDLRLTVPKKAFRGYPIVAPVHAAGVPDGGKVTVQRRAGKKWRRVASTTVFRERGTVVFRLPKGRVRVRLKARVGTQSDTSRVRVVRVAAPRGWTTTHDGRYRGKAEGADLTLKVASGGRQIRDFDTEVSMFCVGPTPADNHFLIGVAPVKRAKIAPDGRFYSRTKHATSTVIVLSGRVHNGRVKGQVELTVGTCAGTADYRAKLKR
jgi:hypothetical protein